MCLSLGWLENLLIWLIVIVAVVAILKIVVPLVLSQIGVAGTTILQIINIVVWAIVLIAIVIFAFEMIGCLLSLHPLSRVGNVEWLQRWSAFN